MKRGARKTWRWRVADKKANQDLNLLYEPGNWGDVLKGMWASIVSTGLARRTRGLNDREREELRYLDPFAGAPTYPLVEAASRRLAGVPPGRFRELQDAYAGKGLMASTALLIRDAAQAEQVDVRMEVFDADPARRVAWGTIEGAKVVEAPSGEAIVEALEGREEPPHLVLIDPYDFFVRWSFFLPHALSAARRSVVLAYSYNRSPRGPGQQRMYEDFRKALQARLPKGREALIGRVPADATVARAYHEMLLLGLPTDLEGLREELEAATRALARTIVAEGAFEIVGQLEVPPGHVAQERDHS